MSVDRVAAGFEGGGPVEVEGVQLVWEPADGMGPSIPAGTLGLIEQSLSFEASPEFMAWFDELVSRLPESRAHRAAAHRRAWSGPDRLERQILRAYGVSAAEIGLTPRSFLDGAYRRRQRARVKRRRR